MPAGELVGGLEWHSETMEEAAGGQREARSVVTSAEWPVPRRVAIPRDGDELSMLKAYLEHHRESISLKCSGVPLPRMSERSAPPSSMSLHGLIRHLAGVERWWFAINFAGMDLPMLYYSDDDPDQDFESLDGDPLEALRVWQAECQRSREILDAAPSFYQVGVVARNGSYTLRWLMLRMIGEYAQHAGHADLLREGIDGAVGS